MTELNNAIDQFNSNTPDFLVICFLLIIVFWSTSIKNGIFYLGKKVIEFVQKLKKR